MPRRPKTPQVKPSVATAVQLDSSPPDIVAATAGWRALYRRHDGRHYSVPVAAWQTHGGKIAAGLVSVGAEFKPASALAGFAGYIGPEQGERDNPATWFAPSASSE